MINQIETPDEAEQCDGSAHTQQQRMSSHPNGRSEHQFHCSGRRFQGSPCRKRSMQMKLCSLAHCLALTGNQFCRLQSGCIGQQELDFSKYIIYYKATMPFQYAHGFNFMDEISSLYLLLYLSILLFDICFLNEFLLSDITFINLASHYSA
jgi:hypothetical protein